MMIMSMTAASIGSFRYISNMEISYQIHNAIQILHTSEVKARKSATYKTIT